MRDALSEIRWSQRVPRWKIRRLYESDAEGLLDQELPDEVGFSLLQRCKDIVVVKESKKGRVECPRCANRGEKYIIHRTPKTGGKDIRDEVIKCPRCEWKITWGEYALNYKRKQLNAGTTEMFETYIRKYMLAKTPKEKLFVIDQLIHEFHHAIINEPEIPGRPVCANLIQGKLSDTIEFLNELSFGTSREMSETREKWQWGMELQKHRYSNLEMGPKKKIT